MAINNFRDKSSSTIRSSYTALRAACVAGACGLVVFSACNNGSSAAAGKADSGKVTTAKAAVAKDTVVPPPAVAAGPLDTALYNQLIKHLANGDSSGRWPVKRWCNSTSMSDASRWCAREKN